MSVMTKPAVRSARETTERIGRTVAPVLRRVPEQVSRPARLPFAILVVSVLAVGLVAVLFLNISIAQDSYRLQDLKQRTTVLDEHEESLRQRVAAESRPEALAQKAEAQGMVPAGAPAFIEVPSGKVRGDPHKVKP
ncbi:MAG: hypothetical protein ACRDMV_09350 [Streptosporangiales bacterium]